MLDNALPLVVGAGIVLYILVMLDDLEEKRNALLPAATVMGAFAAYYADNLMLVGFFLAVLAAWFYLGRKLHQERERREWLAQRQAERDKEYALAKIRNSLTVEPEAPRQS